VERSGGISGFVTNELGNDRNKWVGLAILGFADDPIFVYGD
jgi:hypothetical protein